VKSNLQKQARSQFPASTDGAVKRAAPFLKWAGGKTQLLPAFDQFVPARFNQYYEPFVGGGAMFFHMHNLKPAASAVLSDLNEELINCYRVVRDDVDELIACLKKHRNEKDYFYKVRAQDTARMSDAQRAARLIYLNKTCFNGLYRVNRRGQFNVPFGSYKNPRTCDEANLHAVSHALQHVTLQTQSFAKSLRSAGKGDFVYLDPPYQPLSTTSNFTSYTSKCFGESDQQELARTVKELDRRGSKFMLSNSDNEFIRALYADFRIETVLATRAINCRGDRRGKITEVLVLNY
jgi:DNA adenine methylase